MTLWRRADNWKEMFIQPPSPCFLHADSYEFPTGFYRTGTTSPTKLLMSGSGWP